MFVSKVAAFNTVTIKGKTTSHIHLCVRGFVIPAWHYQDPEHKGKAKAAGSRAAYLQRADWEEKQHALFWY